MTSAPEPPVLRCRTPGELVEAVPYLLGFHPVESLVAVSLRGPRQRIGLTLRVDLPRPADSREIAALVAGHLRRDGAHAAIGIVYTAHAWGPGVPLPRRDLVRDLVDATEDAEVELVDVLCVDGGRWRSYQCAQPDCCPPEGTPVHSDGHVSATATYAGLRAAPSRAALVGEVAPAPDRSAVAAALPAAVAATEAARARSEATAAARSRAALRCALDRVGRGRPPSAQQVARALVALTDVSVRDWCAEWPDVDRYAALDLWGELLRRAPQGWAAEAGALRAFTAWRLGDGTRASAALDRVLAEDPEHRLGRLVDAMLQAGVPPREWPQPPPRADGRRRRRGGRGAGIDGASGGGGVASVRG